MRYLLTLVVLLLTFFSGEAQESGSANITQMANPITWEASIKKENDSIFLVLFTANLEEGWHLYSQNVEEGGPIPTTFTFSSNEGFELLGEMQEPDIPAIYDAVFEMEIKYFKVETVFRQRVKLLDPSTVLVVEVEFMVCDDERCLPPDVVPFQIMLEKGSAVKEYADANVSDRDLEKTAALDIQIRGWETYEPEEVKDNAYLSIFLLGFVED